MVTIFKSNEDPLGMSQKRLSKSDQNFIKEIHDCCVRLEVLNDEGKICREKVNKKIVNLERTESHG